MKRFGYRTLTTSVALLVCLAESFAQSGWIWQNPIPQGNPLRSVSFTSQNGAVAVGDIGTILRTTDGGSSWKLSSSGTEANLYGVYFADQNNGWAVGGNFLEEGIILHTSDGGINWKVQLRDSVVYPIRHIHFSSLSQGVAVGGKFCFHTTNGGAAWTKQSIPQISSAYGVFLTSSDTGYMVGSLSRPGGFSDPKGVVLKTIDGCTTWTLQDSVQISLNDCLNDINFLNSTTGFAVGENGAILKTTNGGTKWTLIQAGITEPIAQVSWINSATAVAVSGSTSYWTSSGGGKIFRTTDGGTSWPLVQSGTTNWLYSISFRASGVGIAVGDYGTIVQTTDGGMSWNLQSQGTNELLTDVTFTSTMKVYAVGSNGILLQTTDGGVNWKTLTTGTSTQLWKIRFFDANIGTIVGDYTILRTTNGGMSWVPQQGAGTNSLQGVFFTSSQTGFAAGSDPSQAGGTAVLLRTTNSGATWLNHSIPTTKALYDIVFVNPDTGFLAAGNFFTNGGAILRTIDGGITWAVQSTPVNNGVHAISFANSRVGYAVGPDGMILKSSNGGAAWTKQSPGVNGDFFAVFAVDTATAFVVGNIFPAGKILKTTDGGTTWTKQPGGSVNTLLGIYFTDAMTGVVVGAGGAILRTTNGGNLTKILKEESTLHPGVFMLSQNYPNPFNPATVISFYLPAGQAGSPLTSHVTLKVFDIIGREVATLVNEERQAGSYTVQWNAEGFASGVYFYRLQAGSLNETKKLMLQK